MSCLFRTKIHGFDILLSMLSHGGRKRSFCTRGFAQSPPSSRDLLCNSPVDPAFLSLSRCRVALQSFIPACITIRFYCTNRYIFNLLSPLEVPCPVNEIRRLKKERRNPRPDIQSHFEYITPSVKSVKGKRTEERRQQSLTNTYRRWVGKAE